MKRWISFTKQYFWISFLFLLFFCIILVNRKVSGQEIEKEYKKFGATYMTMDNPYFEAVNYSIQEVVEANGDLLIVRDPMKNQEKQNQQIQEFLDEGVEAIFLNPVDWKGVVDILEQCEEQNVPVFVVDTHVYNPQNVVSTIISDNYQAGVEIAKDMMRKRTEADIAIIGEGNINSINLRVKGFLDTIEGREEYRIVVHRTQASSLQTAMNVMQSVLDNGAVFDVVLGGNDPTILGALAALQKNNIERDILLYGVDGSPDVKTMIKEGHIEGSSAQFPYSVGRAAANTAYKYLEGNKVDTVITIKTELITSRNLEKFDLAGWQ